MDKRFLRKTNRSVDEQSEADTLELIDS